MKIISSAPGKLILFGEHASSRGKPAIVFAVNKRLTVTLSKCKVHKILLTSKEFNVYQEEYPTMKLDMVSSLIATFFRKYSLSEKPLDIVIESDIQSGFGSSAALIVALYGALFTYFDIMPSRLEFLKICIDFNQDFKGYGSGLDIATSLYGGIIKFQMGRKPKSLPYENVKFVVGNTGFKAPSGPIVQQVRDYEYKDPIEAKKIFDRIREIVINAEEAILENDQRTLGNLMNENQDLLRALNVSSSILEELISAAIDNDALGAKLSGAGVGDNMLALVTEDTRDKITTALNQTKGKALSTITIDSKGLIVNQE